MNGLRPGAGGKAGFTLLEILLVLGLAALMAAIAMPRIAASIDQITAHGEYLKFQQQVMDLRRQSFHEAQGVRLVSTGEFSDSPDADPPLAEAQLGPGWSYRLSQPMDIDAAGSCAAVDVDLFKDGRPLLHLQGSGASCRFLR